MRKVLTEKGMEKMGGGILMKIVVYKRRCQLTTRTVTVSNCDLSCQLGAKLGQAQCKLYLLENIVHNCP